MTQSHHFGIIAAMGYLSTSRQKFRILPSVSFQANIFFKNTTSYFYRAQAVVATLCMSPHCLVSLPPDHPLLGLHLCSLHTSCDVTAVLPSLVRVYTSVTLENSFYDRFYIYYFLWAPGLFVLTAHYFHKYNDIPILLTFTINLKKEL